MGAQGELSTDAVDDLDAGGPEGFRSGDPEQDMEACREVHEILGLVGDRWSLPVMGQLLDRPLRFGELQRATRGISQRMLTFTLRRLERDGLISRTVHPSVPPRVEYALTPLGAALLRPAAELGRWAFAHRHEIQTNQRDYDERCGG
ncbi:winged helix-turn-helix transcriptional regulator [Streptomyces sp. NPDC053750]|uniref:winged helix-turn-helix transcriptional regulator n=1 Tax=Streptomyces sp. NPDC053750 TaxID=3365714 RepID=UPI0037D6EDE2